MQEEKERTKKQEENQEKKGKHGQRKCRSGFKIVKMAVQNFDVLRFFLGNLRSKFANFVGTKNAYFCRKEAKVAQRSTLFWFMLTFELPKCAYFCRTEHVVAQRSTSVAQRST